MALTISVDGPLSSAESASLELFRVEVADDDYEMLTPSFTYMVWRDVQSVRLASVTVGMSFQYATEHGAPDPIRASAIRDLPFVRWESAARAKLVGGLSFGAMGLKEILTKAIFERGKPFTADEAHQVLGATILDLVHPGVRDDQTPGGRRHFRSLSKLALTAAEYVWFQSEGRSDPSIAIAEKHDVPPSTARSWIFRARQAGLLTPAMTARMADDSAQFQALAATITAGTASANLGGLQATAAGQRQDMVAPKKSRRRKSDDPGDKS